MSEIFNVTAETTYRQLAKATGIPLKDLLQDLKDKGYKVKRDYRVRATSPHYSRVRKVLDQYELAVGVKFIKVAASVRMANHNHNMALYRKKVKTISTAELVEAFGKATRNRRLRKTDDGKLIKVTKTAAKKTSANNSGLTIRELEKEIFFVDKLRVVIRAPSHLRSGCTTYGKALPKGSTVETLTRRLERYFRSSRHAEELAGVEFVVITPRGEAHHNTRTKKLPIARARFE